LWEESQIKKAEPDIQAVAAIYCSETGIVETKELMTAYLADAENASGTLVLNKHPVKIKRNQEQLGNLTFRWNRIYNGKNNQCLWIGDE
jgi:L-2-hydroxyglutarate oxidase LhgO